MITVITYLNDNTADGGSMADDNYHEDVSKICFLLFIIVLIQHLTYPYRDP